MDGSGEHHAKLGKPDSETQGLYVFSYMWKLERKGEEKGPHENKRENKGGGSCGGRWKGKIWGNEIDQIIIFYHIIIVLE